jgi:hypothetical protein
MLINRRSLLASAASLPLLGQGMRLARAEEPASEEKADYTLRIATGLAELAPEHIVSTALYNGQFPGPLLRFKEGQRAVVDVHNDTDTPELVHWHGQMIPSDVDGAAEEGSPHVPPHAMRRISFVPKPAGFRFYHTHVVAGGDLNRGTYTGQVGPVYIEPKNEPGAYDREVFLVLKEFGPSFSRGGDMAMDFLAGAPVKELQAIGKKADDEAKERAKGFEVGYDLFSINGKSQERTNIDSTKFFGALGACWRRFGTGRSGESTPFRHRCVTAIWRGDPVAARRRGRSKRLGRRRPFARREHGRGRKKTSRLQRAVVAGGRAGQPGSL